MFGRTNAKGVPMNALVLCLAICVSILGVHFVSGGDLFLMLAKSSGAFVMIVWIFIIVAHFAMRRQDKHAPRDPQAFRAWFYPVSNWIALLALVAVLGSQAFNPDSRFQFWFTVLTALAIVAAYFLRRKPAQLDETAGAKAR